MSLYNQDIIDKIIYDYKKGISIDDLVSFLEDETRKPISESKINLSSLEKDRPNIIPWNTLGLILLKDKKYYDSEKVWRKVISLAYELSQERYSNVPPIGLPFNNLALTLQAQNKYNDALMALIRAYIFDIQTGNPGQIARNNFINISNQVLLNFLSTNNLVQSNQDTLSNKKIKKDNILSLQQFKPSIYCYSLIVWLSFLLPTFLGCYMLYSHPNNWYFLFLIAIGIISPYFYKDISIKILGGGISVKNPSLQEIKSGFEPIND